MSLVQLRPEAPPLLRGFAGIAHPVERHLAKVEVASSSLVARSKKSCGSAAGFIWRHSQVVRQRTANPRFPGSSPGGASKERIPRLRRGIRFVFVGKSRPGSLKHICAAVNCRREVQTCLPRNGSNLKSGTPTESLPCAAREDTAPDAGTAAAHNWEGGPVIPAYPICFSIGCCSGKMPPPFRRRHLGQVFRTGRGSPAASTSTRSSFRRLSSARR